MMLETVSDIRERFAEMYYSSEFVTDKTGVKTLELTGASFIANEDHIFGSPNDDYIRREIKWYESQSLYVKDIPGKTPVIWEQVADKDGKINSNYGWCIRSGDNGYQYEYVINELLENTNSRRAVMIYNRPSMHKDYCANGMNDFMCTNAVQYLIRNDTMISVVQMRSNDVVFGYRNDYAWQKHVLDELFEEYNLMAETPVKYKMIKWQVGSLHVYERHFGLIEDFLNGKGIDLKKMKAAEGWL